MAKVLVEEDCIDIRVSMLERMMLAERSRKVPLSQIRRVSANPPLLDLMVHWADHGNVWLGGVSSYEGHMIPSSCNPKSTLAIEMSGDDEPQIFIEVDNAEPEELVLRISRAIGSEPPPPTPRAEARREDQEHARSVASDIARVQELARYEQDEHEEDEEDELLAIQRRDPLMQGSLHPPPRVERKRAAKAPRDAEASERKLATVGSLLLAAGSAIIAFGAWVVALGTSAGLLAVGVGVACGALGGITLGVIAHQQG